MKTLLTLVMVALITACGADEHNSTPSASYSDAGGATIVEGIPACGINGQKVYYTDKGTFLATDSASEEGSNVLYKLSDGIYYCDQFSGLAYRIEEGKVFYSLDGENKMYPNN